MLQDRRMAVFCTLALSEDSLIENSPRWLQRHGKQRDFSGPVTLTGGIKEDNVLWNVLSSQKTEAIQLKKGNRQSGSVSARTDSH